MKKLLVVASVVTGAAYPATACEWNREASARAPVVAATTTTAEASPAAQPMTSVAVDERARQPVTEPVPVVLVTDRR
jgi:hypothetical protein